MAQAKRNEYNKQSSRNYGKDELLKVKSKIKALLAAIGVETRPKGIVVGYRRALHRAVHC